jgi:PHD/YefM family antitoxin component YafN of YafNO toxin-antitoxin module
MPTRNPDPRTVPPIESREQWDALVETIETEGDAIVESKGGRKVAVISYDEFLAYQEQRKVRLREEAYTRLQEALKGQAERNADLSEDEIEELAERFSREVIDDLAAEGKLVFERDQT